jgi:hypothetical protein
MLRFARIAADTRRLVFDERFDRVTQDAFTLAAPGINGIAKFYIGVFGCHMYGKDNRDRNEA